MKPMTVSVPAREEWLLVLRLAASGVCGVYDLPVDVLEDVCTAVEESADLLLHQPCAPETLLLQCQEGEDGPVLSLSAQGEAPGSADGETDPDIARMILETLVRDVELRRDGDAVRGVRLRLPVRG